jgi:hypothetical protein
MPRSRPTRQHGGAALVKSHNYPQRGRQAVLADPDGAAGWGPGYRVGPPHDAQLRPRSTTRPSDT